MAITWYGSQSMAESCNFGSLAVVWPLLERMDVAGIINRHLPADSRAEFDHGTVLSLLIAARLHHPIALVNVGQWAAESGADILWNIPLEKITDDRLGESLDAFFTQRHSILASLALHVAKEFDIPLTELHYDPTHILLHGAYKESAPREATREGETVPSDSGLPAAHITTGRPMSDAPKDVQMIHAGLCTVDQATAAAIAPSKTRMQTADPSLRVPIRPQGGSTGRDLRWLFRVGEHGRTQQER